jgi:hypothetical protein
MMLTQEQARAQQQALMRTFNPSNPDHVKKMKELTQTATGGRKTIKTAKEMEGKGMYGGIFEQPGGFTFVDTEEERARKDPNSAEMKRARMDAQLKRASDEAYRKTGIKWDDARGSSKYFPNYPRLD